MALPAKSDRTFSQTFRALMGVRELIFSGEISRGERVSEVLVSERLGLSRTPVRAAFVRLEQEGVLELIPSGGYSVRAFSTADIVDAIELRGVLEGTAARLAAERGVSTARMATLNALMAGLDNAVNMADGGVDFHAYSELNAEFHDLLKVLSGSDIVAREIDRVLQLPFAGPSAFLNAQPDFPEFQKSLIIGQAQHRAIVDAIGMREGARAEALTREHSRLARQNLEFVIENRNLMARVPGLSLVLD